MAAMTAAEMQAKIKMRISILQSRSPMEKNPPWTRPRPGWELGQVLRERGSREV
jgi:hypothetical protein